MTGLTALAAHITEYRRQAVVCPACGQTTQAAVPVRGPRRVSDGRLQLEVSASPEQRIIPAGPDVTQMV